ncbi:MAG: flagellar cap protein FliD N-terminal domain-containing protein [Campylobacterota bacterium]|nr:flagellar cap protein FliD N-terminal domain-containing protein [Campylobacterota bacterium]
MAEITSTAPTYDYSMIGSVGGEAAQSVNGDMINKIRAAEEKSLINPITEDIDNISIETEKLQEIKDKALEFQDVVSYFDLYNDENVFNQFLFDTTGSSAVFDAVNMSALEEGTVTIDITQLAQRDVYQSDTIAEVDKDNDLNIGNLSIQIGTATAIEFDTTDKTISELSAEINNTEGLTSSLEQVGTDTYRLVIKSSDSGVDSALTITGGASDDLGYTTDGTTVKAENHTLTSQNLQATIDGIDYDVSSDSITTQGSLEIKGIELGVSSITISKDVSAVTVAAETMVTKYNELQEMLNEEIYSDEAGVEDKSMLRDILSDLKSMLFANYGAQTPTYDNTVKDEYGDVVKEHSNVTNNEMNLFVLGFELDKSGNLAIDTDIFNGIINGEDDNYDLDDLQNIFTGQYTNKGVGVQLKEYLDALDGYDGTFYNYDIDMISKKDDLEKEKEDELERLDTKYGIMAEQFSAYSAIIGQMEAQFNGLKMMIEQSTSGN